MKAEMMCDKGVFEGRHAIMLENIFHLLCGLDTAHLKIGVRDRQYVLIADTGYPQQLMCSFESLGVNIRVFGKFIQKSQYCSDAIKGAIADCIEKKVDAYLKDMVRLRKEICSIESLVVAVGGWKDKFDEIRTVIDGIRGMSGMKILNCINERMENSACFEHLYRGFICACTEIVKNEIECWVLEGKILSEGFMIRINDECGGFEESRWSNRYVLVEENVPYFLLKMRDVVFDCGRVINIGRSITGKNMFKDSRNEYDLVGLMGLNRYLNEQLLELLRPEIEREFDEIYRYLLLNDCAAYVEMLDEIGEEVFEVDERTMVKMNAIKDGKHTTGFCFKIAQMSLNSYVMKILSSEKKWSRDCSSSVLELLTVEYHPRVLRDFISLRVVSELEILFRFLFTLMALSYRMERLKGYRFARVAGMLIDRFRFAIYSRMQHIKVKNDINYVMEKFFSNIKRWLREFYLTNEKTYGVWGDLFDICFRFLDAEIRMVLCAEDVNEYEKELIYACERLKIEVSTLDYNDCFVHFLNGVHWEKVFD
ncbi:hypothetical protein CWI42_011840 [Ordospora colligata]|uniref:Gamma tubulin complex component protein N-terminal domain-containing protein n=1 Tax=Ordospora colligata OC4 TaxID=1354746 RepID=A0A0B2UMK4_9MICR|nr:uncharacterized protein M896_011840 [Ordospora colligata OC4]KHN70529.1 hypothetical protein M896_011840 [Ordospora colligata OC4]TBU17279.1 hypothetical protein CWI41_011840 [Ordospora colligata]TBU17529.1 hypothetical protein CWI40_011840 [Ordospora colligata]TBU19709.1 hypothetical protein CWI42_011840 [Ordospora colligata]